MKTSLFSFLLFAPLSVVAHQNDETTPSMLRRRSQSNRQSVEPCTVLITSKIISPGVEEEHLECELQGDDLGGKDFRMVDVQGLSADWAKLHDIVSGVSTIFARGSLIDDYTNALVVNTDADVEVGENRAGSVEASDTRGRNLADDVIKKVLVLRVVASDAETTATETQLADDIFGHSGDVVNLQSQFKACSYDKLQFNALTSNTAVGTDGVYTVHLPNTVVAGARGSIIRNAVRDEATLQLGSLKDIADHVIICLPPGTGSWLAYAYVNHWLSVYNDNWCRYPSGQMHEIGHNLGLAHAGEGTRAYGDQSGLMGYSYSKDESPKMCFNGPKSWQLGWYSYYHVDLSTNNYNWSGDLVGFAEKDNTNMMIIRIQDATKNRDTYVHFNRQIGFNSETKEGKNQVLVSTREGGVGYAVSNLEAMLNANEVYTINAIGRTEDSVTITVNSIDTSTTPAKANVSIQLVQPDQCYDDLVAAVVIKMSKKKRKTRDCEWVADNNRRIEKNCKVGHDAFDICKETCENCDGNNNIRPTACTDDASFRFQNNKKKRSCKWLSRKNQGKQEKLCGRNGVADKCPESCDPTCE